MKRLAVAMVLACFSASATDLRTCNPIMSEACRSADARAAKAWKAAHPHEKLAEGNHTILRVERTGDYCYRNALTRIDTFSPVPNYLQARYAMGDCFARHQGTGVLLNSFGDAVGDVP